jgi:hypothetical protein
MIELTVPVEPNTRFFIVSTNHFNYFTYNQVIPGNKYTPFPQSKLITIPSWIPNWLDRPILYWKYLPKYF